MKPSCLCLCIILIATPAIRGQDIPLNVAEQPDTQDKSQLTGLDTDKELDSTATLDEFLVNSEHWGMRSFAQDVADGDYLVNLYFAETFPRITGPGQRVFSFRVNGIEFDEFDIWQKAGGSNRVYVESVPVKINSGILWVTFSSEMDYPTIKAIEIIPQNETASVEEIIRINAGGQATAIDSSGRKWLADQGFMGGRTISGNRFFGNGGFRWAPTQSTLVFMNHDEDVNLRLEEAELPAALRFVHPRLDEDQNGVASVVEVARFDAFILRHPQGSELKAALTEDTAPTEQTIARLRETLDAFESEAARLDADVVVQLSTAKQAEWGSYLFTVVAMMLAALSFGHLLTANPPRRQRWTQIDASPIATRTVIESLVLIGLLSCIDLLWTTTMSTEIHFQEMNPVGNHFLLEGTSLTAFKVVSLASALALLFFLRKFKGAQMASWWTCMVCTLVTFRWIVLDSTMLS